MLFPTAITLALAGVAVASPGWRFWPGPFSSWASVTHIISFGDSYTQTGFDPKGPQPSRANPLGNPDYPGDTSSNGPNWIDFLTTTWNRTLVKTVNLAFGGATVDGDLIPAFAPTVISLKQQINDQYVPIYSKHPSYFNWQPQSTLFTIFIGINDVNNGYNLPNKSQLYSQELTEYAQLVDTLYQTGARNFVLLNVPPIDRDPITTETGEAAVESQKTDIAAWNGKVNSIVKNLNRKPGVTAFLFDANALYNKVIDEPCSYPETCALKDTSSYCPMYAFGTPTWYSKDPQCEYPLNTLHPTFRIHNATAREIANRLSTGRYWWL
ncbi:carbohydrate esterase family 16 protein [Zasmidium cellare ATCC 36951]|uniref:Carbohydrate esterase family 16 protein n=1 Tax=Zasmidium cellare ATCC 36951 TaxID=1080233 RepID=A0A6A6CVL4_ZASCE|nr:carbohydrate esterase family 16 protein [Zasmidium cellare ATCC 36951]KAF2170240.1 carbohydrate esterase family 16 protein [Zasmidium cellare ATCC 36951]